MLVAHSKPRRGSIYVAVVGATLVVGVMATAAMTVARVELRAAALHRDQRAARLLALSAVEFGVNWINRDPSWRTSLTNDVETSPIPLGNGSITAKVVDADGSLTDDPTEPVTLVGYGRVGEAVAVESVELEPAGLGLACVESALHSAGDVILESPPLLSPSTDVATNQTISSNDNVYASASNVNVVGNAEAVSSVSGSVLGVATPGVQSRKMPTVASFNYYKYNGAWIDVSAIPQPVLGGPRKIENKVLSPGNNPFGAETNVEGVYVIDCQGQELHVQNSRIVGTLVLLNNSAASRTLGSVNWEPAAANFPALLTENGFEFRHDGGSLGETLLLTNFNPSHTPYEGAADADALDSYPSRIRGLVYIGGLMRVDGATPYFAGSVVCEQAALASAVRFDYRETYLLNPPPGFGSGPQMRIISGSWRRASAD